MGISIMMKCLLIVLHAYHVASRFTLTREHVALTAASKTGSFMQQTMTSDAKLQMSFASAFREEFAVVEGAFAESEADMEMGSDLGIDLGMNTTESVAGTSGPTTLAEYCSGAETKQEKQTSLKEGVRVRADWEGYGPMYPGKITDTHHDGTVDIHYDDGFDEKRVDVDDIKVRKHQSPQRFLLQVFAPRDDAACQFLSYLEKLKKRLAAIREMIAQWLGAQRAKVAGDVAPPPPPSSMKPVTTTAAPSPPQFGAAPAPAVAGPISGDQATELEKLKAQLADRDKFLAELEKLVAANEKELQKYNPVSANTAPAGITTVDDLIAQYKAKIAERDARIAELQKIIKDQMKELARLSGTQLSLSEIDAAVQELAKDVGEAKIKRDKLDKEGNLDDELRRIIDNIIKALKEVRAKVDKLLALDAFANKERQGADDAAKAAAAEARKRAIAAGATPEEAEAAAKSAFEAVIQKTTDVQKEADIETMKAAQDMANDLKEVEKGTKELDTGLHPHGDKWWRYRYEHSYVEAVVMIFVSWLLLVWNEIVVRMTRYVFRKAHALHTIQHTRTRIDNDDEAAIAVIAAVDDNTHGSVYVTWLRDFGEQMMVCVFVFLTIWIISKTVLLDYAPMLIKPNDDLRVPLTGNEYRHLAMEILTIFFFGIVFYFALMFFVARHTRKLTRKLEKREAAFGDQNSEIVGTEMSRRLSTTVGYQLGGEVFATFLRQEAEKVEDKHPLMDKISTNLEHNFHAFPIGQYITLNVRLVTPFMFKFGWVMWLPTICLFLTLMLLHRFAHMGYVRVICFFTVVVLVLILGMAYICRNMEKKLETYKAAQESPRQEKSFHNEYESESIFLGVLQFCLFFTCYGVARMICQPWMWELHFWPVLCLTCIAVVCAVLFIFLVAPVIPTFVAIMALPPYVDENNWQQVLYISRKMKNEREDYMSRQR